MYTVLLVDDEEKILEVMKVRIGWQELGVDKLLTASDGQAALEYFEQQRIDLLVTDIRMPRMDGLELIEKVRSLYPDTHCILLTAMVSSSMPAVPSSLVLRTTCSSRSPMWKWSRPFRKRWIISTTAARTAGIFCGKTR